MVRGGLGEKHIRSTVGCEFSDTEGDETRFRIGFCTDNGMVAGEETTLIGVDEGWLSLRLDGGSRMGREAGRKALTMQNTKAQMEGTHECCHSVYRKGRKDCKARVEVNELMEAKMATKQASEQGSVGAGKKRQRNT